MNWKEFFSKNKDESGLLENSPMTQVCLKDGTTVSGRLIDIDPFVVVENYAAGSNIFTPDDIPTGGVWILKADEIRAIKLVLDLPKSWDGFDEAAGK